MNDSKGLTLIELSIVLVIIGLIVAAVVAGKELIQASYRQKIISQYDKFKTAVNVFELKYDDMPGDIPYAYDYWGSVAGCTDNHVEAVITGCNGDGNGEVSHAVGTYREGVMAWQHLYLAGLLPNPYSGVLAGDSCVFGDNVPSISGLSAGYILLPSFASIPYDAAIMAQFGTNDNVGITGCADYGAFSPVDGKSIDMKIDDGLASSPRGIMVAIDSATGGTCVSGSEYDLTATGKDCRFFFLIRK